MQTKSKNPTLTKIAKTNPFNHFCLNLVSVLKSTLSGKFHALTIRSAKKFERIYTS